MALNIALHLPTTLQQTLEKTFTTREEHTRCAAEALAAADQDVHVLH